MSESSDADEFDDLDEGIDEDEQGRSEPEVTIEISGLSLFTHVGVTAAEREVGQRLLLDLRIDVGECDATITDRIEDTVDYAEVCEVVSLGSFSAAAESLSAGVLCLNGEQLALIVSGKLSKKRT